MKTSANFIELKRKAIASLFILLTFTGCLQDTTANPLPDPTPPTSKKIKVALLLDTSNSMDGLINQAKSQLWEIVNELAAAKCEGERPDISIALYEYGNDRLPGSEGFIRMVTPLTNDLDQISADLFGLTTNGGSEFCGHVIQTATNQLDWGQSNEDLKLIFIAGNEPFNQGSVNYTEACSKANRMGITINTIFCGDFNEGVNTFWKNGADIASGHYMSIEQNKKTVYIASPYDDQISQLNNKLNQTYVYYGKEGKSKKVMQEQQDANAASYGQQNMVSRTVSKSSHVYKNESWDLVDAAGSAEFEMSAVDETYIPEEMKKMDDKERLDYINEKKDEREKINKEISELSLKRTEYVNNKKKEMGENEKSLDQAMMTAIKTQAKSKNFVFEK